MAARTQELALRYLLELSSDIRLAMLLDREGALLAAAPQSPPGRLAELAGEFAGEVGSRFAPDGEDVEVDAVCDGGTLFLIRSAQGAMVCLTDRSVLPALIFYDMHAVLTDLDRAAHAEARRVEVAER